MLGSIIQLIFLVLLIRQIIIFLVAWYTGLNSDVPFKATSKKNIQALSKYLKRANVKNLLELGSGSGRVSVNLAKNIALNITAVEKNNLLYQLAKIKDFITGKKLGQITWQRADFFQTNLQNYEAIYLYLSPKVNQLLAPKLSKEITSKTLIISHYFPIKHHQLKLHQTINKKIFVYKKAIS